jgi:hypothetical protein
MRLWIGIVTFLVGVAIWYRKARAPARGPVWLGRLGLGTASLGLSTLAMTQSGMSWTISSICFSIVAITLLGWVVVETFRR